MEGFPSGQREQTVNLSAKPSEVRILPPPPALYSMVPDVAGIAQLVEHQPSKLRVASSSLVSRSRAFVGEVVCVGAHVAQSVERILGKDEVTGSNPVVGSMFDK